MVGNVGIFKYLCEFLNKFKIPMFADKKRKITYTIPLILGKDFETNYHQYGYRKSELNIKNQFSYILKNLG